MADQDKQDKKLVARFGRWAAWAVALGVLLYVGGTVWVGLEAVGSELAGFSWPIYIPVLLLTLVNYGGRFLKWHYLLRRLEVQIGWAENLGIYVAGLAMVISPGKVGELLKPWLVSKRTGVSMATTTPALVAERLTDGIAMLMLAAIGVSTYAADSVHYVVVPMVLIALGLGVLMSRRLSLTLIRLLGRLPVIRGVAHKLEASYSALLTCLSPVALLYTLGLSLVAWWAECVGYLLVFEGLGLHDLTLDACTFLYAFATIAGGAMPGGLGVADGALVGGAVEILGVPEPAALASALLIRVATLWFGVVLGAFALLWFDRLLGGVELDEQAAGEDA